MFMHSVELPEHVKAMRIDTPEELRNLNVVGASTAGWDSKVQLNETMDSHGNVILGTANNGANNGEADESPWAKGIKRRCVDDPGVIALREHLKRNNGMTGLEICEPHEVDRAARIFHRDGFVVVRNLLNADQLEMCRAACSRVMGEILAYPGPEGRKYLTESGRLPHRYSFGTSSASRQMLHDPLWASLTELPSITPIIAKIYGSQDYAISGAGGDICLPGAVEYQVLHRDGPPFGDPPKLHRDAWARRIAQANLMGINTKGKELENLSLHMQRRISEACATSGTINFTMIDSTWENGPIRQIPGSHCNVQFPPRSDEEPEWMRLSTLVGVPAGSGIFRDHRAWHGATPNLSNEIRCMPNIEWVAPWAASKHIAQTMPYEIWSKLTPLGQHVCRFVHAPPDVWPAGAGVMHPLSSGRLAAFDRMGGMQSLDSAHKNQVTWEYAPRDFKAKL